MNRRSFLGLSSAALAAFTLDRSSPAVPVRPMIVAGPVMVEMRGPYHRISDAQWSAMCDTNTRWDLYSR
jgi:hypothetical protein